MKRLFSAALLALLLALPTHAQSPVVTVNGETLSPQEGWVEDGTSYITLRGLQRVLEDSALHWDGTAALLTGQYFTLSAQLGAQYIELNDRALHLPQGVTAPQGQVALPTRLLADALEGTAHWDEEGREASLVTGQPNPEEASYNQQDLQWLSAIISAESRGETLTGQIAVGNVVLNRLHHWRYPDTIQGVIFDDNYGVQFEPVANGSVYLSPTDLSIIAAKLSLEGADVVGDCLYFFAPALSPGSWIRQNTQYVTTIGCHQFYRDWS